MMIERPRKEIANASEDEQQRRAFARLVLHAPPRRLPRVAVAVAQAATALA
ncbi:MAG: hypothetical protein JWN85_3546 [Gammaproteobacteria bacterium]|nr:hypothetical protein [Gammaproteobacteria bacterium]